MQLTHCKNCSQPFKIAPEDERFYKKLKVPHPTHCPDCRLQRRLAFRNERNLYNSTCALCNKPMIALFPEDTPFTVYCQNCWWSDKWEPHKYAQEIDFDRPFFEQWGELFHKVPMLGIVNDRQSLVNSDYVNYMTDAKNCYLCFAANYLEDCMHSDYIWESKDTVDCSNGTALELCYECTDCDKCYNCNHLTNSQSCSDCTLGYDLKNCHNSFACVQLRNARYYFLNKKLNKEEYKKRVAKTLSDPTLLEQTQKEYEKLTYKHPREYTRQLRCENSTGDAIKNCKNCHDCFEGYGGEDLKWVINFPGKLKDCYDISGCARLELSIEGQAVGLPGYNIRYCHTIINGGRDMTYCAFTDGGREQFGCVGTKKAKHCILNKQYSPEEYKRLCKKLIAHMTETGEWGEFFPAELSPFKYEETVANLYFPL
jgi:hypothetical protein